MKQLRELKGITLIALVITIIVLLILAGVTIATLTGDNGLLSKAQEAKKSSEVAEMSDRIQTAMLAAQSNIYGELTKEKLEEQIQSEFKGEDTKVIVAGKSFIIQIGDKVYNTNGELIKTQEIKYAGDLSKNGQYDGLTEETAYRINCIEDLVEWTNNYNTYKDNYIELEKTLDFEDPESYSNFIQVLDKDINENGKKEYIIIELTTGTGFKPITNFAGTFDGKTNEIRNIYENTTGNAGLFATSSGTIKKLGITGEINSTGNVGGFVGLSNAILINCYNKCKVLGGESAGGLMGYGRFSMDDRIYNCYNSGYVESANYAGGLYGNSSVNTHIYNSYNSGTISGKYVGGASGQCPLSYHLYINNFYNAGHIILSSDNKAGGIVGYFPGTNSAHLNNVFYIDELKVPYTYYHYYNERLRQPSAKQYMQSQEFVDALNGYIESYTPEEGEEDIVLTRWKYNENDYPTFVD